MIYSKQLRVYSNNLKIWVTLTSSAVGIVVEIEAVEVDSAVEEASGAEATVQNRCSRPFAASAETSAKCHLDQVETGRYFAVIVSKRRAVAMTDLNLLQRDLTATLAIWAFAPAVLQITARNLRV